MAKTKEEIKDMGHLSNKELENIDGGRISPTWIPVDESCPEFNSGTTCPWPIMKGKYDNCCDCKHNK